MMANKYTTLGFFKDLVYEEELDGLKMDFHKLADAPNRDGRKEYDEEKEAYYLFRKNHATYEISDQSYPRKFSETLRQKLDRELKKSTQKIDQQVELRTEQGSIKKYLRLVYQEICGMIEYINNSPKLSKYDSISKTFNKLLIYVENKIKTLDFNIPTGELQNVFRRKNYNDPPNQDDVVRLVRELMSKSRFLAKNGEPKPTPIRDEILEIAQEDINKDDKRIEILISERRMFDRVKDAIEEIEFYDVD